MNRGDVWWVDFKGTVAREVRKQRPGAIVSNDIANRNLNRVQIVPLSTKVDRVYPSEALVTVRRKPHKAMADQIMTASKHRLKNRVGRLSRKDLEAVDRTLRIQLGL
ncbi:MAG TPA: type II toxin-antitoxin system PemK/MazF family toxin [Planctomycetota bacterium]|nr:type II toxin-antitoxin system PemK/MazF family toxin [Planctomycetota bacterium]